MVGFVDDFYYFVVVILVFGVGVDVGRKFVS